MIIDISDPTNIVVISELETLGYARDITIEDDFAYVACEDTGMLILDISDPSNTSLRGFYDEAIMTCIDVHEGKAYASGYDSVGATGNLYIFDCTDAVSVSNLNESLSPTEFVINNTYPNPFNPTLNVEIALPHSNNLHLKVFNIVGNEVAILSNGQQYGSGYHNFVFDGSDLSSGIYFVHASIPGQLKQIKRVVLMK